MKEPSPSAKQRQAEIAVAISAELGEWLLRNKPATAQDRESAYHMIASRYYALAIDEASLQWAKEATIAWSVCASIHREYARGKDPFFTTRQSDFTKHEEAARATCTEYLGDKS